MATALHHANGCEPLTDFFKHRNVALAGLPCVGVKAGHGVIPVETSQLRGDGQVEALII